MSTRAMVERSKEMKSLGYTGLHAFLFYDHADAASGSLREVQGQRLASFSFRD